MTLPAFVRAKSTNHTFHWVLNNRYRWYNHPSRLQPMDLQS